MKVIIDIPENDYKLACDYPEALIDCYARYIKNGTPLPEKHGRLIDADILMRDINKYHVSDGKFQHWIEVQQTVVEAEGE